jgi:hypothetical protein
LLLAVAAAGGALVKSAWRAAAPALARNERFLVAADDFTVNPPPEWCQADVARQVLGASGLAGRLSLLDPSFATAVHDAFALHPWVERVEGIRKAFPPAVHVQLVYRQPVAAIESPGGGGIQLLPVDRYGIHLPARDIPEIRLRYLPRIGNVVGQPVAGQRWDDPRVAGAVELAVGLADVWDALHLMEIIPSALPEIRGNHRFYTYDLASRGGTRIVWGAAPGVQAPDESPLAEKLARLQKCVAQVGPLDTVRSPGSIDVRRELAIQPRG